MDLPDADEDLDLTLRHITRQLPEQLARALLPPGTVISSVSWADTQVTSRQRRLDRALDIVADGTRRLEHSEEDVMESSVFKMGEQRGEQRSLARLYEKRLGRPLTTDERATLATRIQALGVDRVEDALLGLSVEALGAWIHDPSAA